MGTRKKAIVSVDGEAAKDAVVQAGRKAKKSVARKVASESGRAKQRVRQAGRSAAGAISGKAVETRRALGREVERRRDASLRRVLRTCISLSKKQTAVLEKLENTLST